MAEIHRKKPIIQKRGMITFKAKEKKGLAKLKPLAKSVVSGTKTVAKTAHKIITSEETKKAVHSAHRSVVGYLASVAERQKKQKIRIF